MLPCTRLPVVTASKSASDHSGLSPGNASAKFLPDELLWRQAEALAVKVVHVDELGGLDTVTRPVELGLEHGKGDGDVPLHAKRLLPFILCSIVQPVPPHQGGAHRIRPSITLYALLRAH